MHYAVCGLTKTLPTYDDICDILAPYDENLHVAPYVYKTKAEIIDEAKKAIANKIDFLNKEPEEVYKQIQIDGSPERVAAIKKELEEEIQDYVPAYKTNDAEKLYQYGINNLYTESDRLDQDGNYLSTYNPDSKWDWFAIGGRFEDHCDDTVAEGECDSMPISSYPAPKVLSDEEIKRQYPDIYESYQKIQAGTYHSIYNADYLRRCYPTLQDYFNACENQTFYAVVTPDGKWHEPGRMGWFSSLAETNDQVEFNRAFYEKFIASMNGEGYYTVVDCHI